MRQGELFGHTDVEMLDRLTNIVDRTRRILGVPAARQLWPMLGLPDLRTSEPDQDGEGAPLSFDFEGQAVRTVVIDGLPWFVGQDVTDRLGYANSPDAIGKHCRGVAKRYPIVDRLGRRQEARVLNEPDVLRLIMRSKLPAAERFERWVFEVVLPEIRRTGKFAVGDGVRGAQSLRTSTSPQGDLGRPPPIKAWIARFLEERCEVVPAAEMRAADFRKAYVAWANEQGAPLPIPSSLGRYLLHLGVRKRKSCGSIYVGLRVKSPSSIGQAAGVGDAG